MGTGMRMGTGMGMRMGMMGIRMGTRMGTGMRGPAPEGGALGRGDPAPRLPQVVVGVALQPSHSFKQYRVRLLETVPNAFCTLP